MSKVITTALVKNGNPPIKQFAWPKWYKMYVKKTETSTKYEQSQVAISKIQQKWYKMDKNGHKIHTMKTKD